MVVVLQKICTTRSSLPLLSNNKGKRSKIKRLKGQIGRSTKILSNIWKLAITNHRFKTRLHIKSARSKTLVEYSFSPLCWCVMPLTVIWKRKGDSAVANKMFYTPGPTTKKTHHRDNPQVICPFGSWKGLMENPLFPVHHINTLLLFTEHFTICHKRCWDIVSQSEKTEVLHVNSKLFVSGLVLIPKASNLRIYCHLYSPPTQVKGGHSYSEYFF